MMHEGVTSKGRSKQTRACSLKTDEMKTETRKGQNETKVNDKVK
jgi:hypothetical protein